jgi:hypothetical protein
MPERHRLGIGQAAQGWEMHGFAEAEAGDGDADRRWEV